VRILLLTIFILFGAGGCLPAYLVGRPAISGRALDSQGHPVPEANVTLRDTISLTPVAHTQSDANGYFASRSGIAAGAS
jgi:hypothetical protein